ncbi:hypothetical protein IE81DRAFT_350437 [Ceraceosorus guamensis]|uniref:Uncharacterized protein n=1 Tax=Ceraceosorus guamensis TaxID=1522189 RepID=A0A316VNN1_9BASI|nr:hypothetical protein IE81DRAFT_350437 [Ceraceosorus guamensis]PWN39142.1 hypothetical protein IE81DRAFT_350437 [Ceraceosorus guamensis]
MSDPFAELPLEVLQLILEYASDAGWGQCPPEDAWLPFLSASPACFAYIMRKKSRHLTARMDRILGQIESLEALPWLCDVVTSVNTGEEHLSYNAFAPELWAPGCAFLDPDIRSIPPIGTRVFMDRRRILRRLYTYHADILTSEMVDRVAQRKHRAVEQGRPESPWPPCPSKNSCDLCANQDKEGWPFKEPADFYDSDAFTYETPEADPEHTEATLARRNGPFGNGLIPNMENYNDYEKALLRLLELCKPARLICDERAWRLSEEAVTRIVGLQCVKELSIGAQVIDAWTVTYTSWPTDTHLPIPSYYGQLIKQVEKLTISVEWENDDRGMVDAADFNFDEWDADSLRVEYVARWSHENDEKTGPVPKLIDDASPNSLAGRLLYLLEAATQVKELVIMDMCTEAALHSARLLPLFACLHSLLSDEYHDGQVSPNFDGPSAPTAHALQHLRPKFLDLVAAKPGAPFLTVEDVQQVANLEQMKPIAENLRKMAPQIVERFNAREGFDTSKAG